MSVLLDIQAQLEDVNAELALLETDIAQNPDASGLRLVHSSLQKRQTRLEEKFEEATYELGIDVLTYRFFADDKRPTMAQIAGALGDFQGLFSVVYDSIKKRTPKERSRISAETVQETAFGFSHTFSGSVGFVFTLPNQRLLFVDSKFDESIKTIANMVKADNPESILEFAKKLGPSPIKALYEWADDHVRSGLGADIEWRRKQEVRGGFQVQKPELKRLQEVILQTDDETEEQITLTGHLIGADVKGCTFHMEFDEGEGIRGRFKDAISHVHTVELPKYYKATMTKKEKVYFATGKVEVTYFLIRLDPAD